MSTASFSSSLSIASRICCLYRSMYTRVEPPPGTIPSSIAAFTELSASSYLQQRGMGRVRLRRLWFGA